MGTQNIKDLLTAFSPGSDFLAITSGDGRIKVWDSAKGHLQTEFTDFLAATSDVGLLLESKLGHLALDYTCMKWIKMEKKKKRKVGGSLLVLGTGSGDVLALDVAAGQRKWKASNCHLGGVSAVASSSSLLYTAGADGMVCQLDMMSGSILRRFRSSSKVVTSLSVTPDGKLLAVAAGQIRIFDTASNKIQKFTGHPVAVRCMTFSEDGQFVLSSGVGERYVAIWKIGDGKNRSASSILSMEHPAVSLDCRCASAVEEDGAMVSVLSISEVGTGYLWCGTDINDLKDKKPTKIAISESSLSRVSRSLTIFSAKLLDHDSPSSWHVLVAYGSIAKPSFEKILVSCRTDIQLEATQTGILMPFTLSHDSSKSQFRQNRVTALDRANVEDAVFPLPKVYSQDKKRKHEITEKNEGVPSAISINLRSIVAKVAVTVERMEKDCTTCIEDRIRDLGLLSPHVDHQMVTKSFGFVDVAALDTNLPVKKIRAHVSSLNPDEACKLLENLVSLWKSKSPHLKRFMQLMYHLLVIHGPYISSQRSSSKVLENLQKMTAVRSATVKDLMQLTGRLHLIMSQIQKAGRESGGALDVPNQSAVEIEFEDEQDDSEDVDELVYNHGAEESDSFSSSDDDGSSDRT